MNIDLALILMGIVGFGWGYAHRSLIEYERRQRRLAKQREYRLEEWQGY